MNSDKQYEQYYAAKATLQVETLSSQALKCEVELYMAKIAIKTWAFFIKDVSSIRLLFN